MTGDADPQHLSRRAFLRTLGSRAAIGVGAFALGYLVDWLWARLVRGFRLEREDYPKAVLGGWRVHHNVVGYILLAVGLFFYPVALIPLGLGMIIGHGMRDGLFWFIERAGG